MAITKYLNNKLVFTFHNVFKIIYGMIENYNRMIFIKTIPTKLFLSYWYLHENKYMLF